MHLHDVAPHVTALTAPLFVPGMGGFPVNAFFLSDHEPMLVDAGITPEVDDFVAGVESKIDLDELKWIFLTHCDRDHTGAIGPLLEGAPHAKILLTFNTIGFMATGANPIPPERAQVVAWGEQLTVGGRDMTVIRPPTFDNGGTAGFLDHGTGALFCSDFLGAILPNLEDAMAEDVAGVAAEDFKAGAHKWASFDSPWVHFTDRSHYESSLAAVGDLGPSVVLSAHAPPIRDLPARLNAVRDLPGSKPALPPTQEQIEAALARVMAEQGDAARA